MDFESPDVAKDFPGLARALSIPDEYEDWDKSKKKKKDSKKEKEKGYAALNDSPDEAEEAGEAKSPGKGMKIKAFKLTSKKKDKEKDKDKKDTTPPKSQEKERVKSSSDSDKKKSVDEKNPPGGGAVGGEGPPPQRRPFDGQSFKHSTIPVSSKSSKVKTTESNAAEGGTTTKPSWNTAGSTNSVERKGLNVFLNAPVPSLLKKKDKGDKPKESKKKRSLSTGKVKLKLKRGSKTSLEESVASSSSEPQHNSPSNPHLPEDPEQISKEIRKYEAMLEQAHAQVKTGKKVSKKVEDQLWELQRTLTQLKRKLRSVNVLSASFPNATTVVSSSLPPQVSSSSSQSGNISASPVQQVAPQAVQISQKVVTTAPTPKTTAEEVPLDVTPKLEAVVEPKIEQPEAAVETNNVKTTTPLPQVTNEATIVITPKNVDNASSVPEIADMPEVKTENHDTIEVEVEVHSSTQINQENATPEDMYEKEIQSFHGGQNTLAPVGKREDINIVGKQLLQVQGTPESSKSKSEDPPILSGDESAASDLRTSEVDLDKGEYNFPATDPTQDSQQPQEEESKFHSHLSRKGVTAPSIFDPFALPEFKTDDFIAAENEALILFNLQLQDEIVKEEEEIQRLTTQIQELSLLRDGESHISDLLSMDDDELVNLWQVVKFENDTLNERVLNLKSLVANSRLEEFRLETRVKYLRERLHCGVIKPEMENVITSH